MDEIYHLKQLIKSVREKTTLIFFLLGFSLVIFIAISLLLSTLLKQKEFGVITKEAASTQVAFNEDNSENDNEVIAYTVVKGDSLWKIAEKILGNGNKYLEIEETNGLEDGQVLNIGQILFINIDRGYKDKTNTQLIPNKVNQDNLTIYIVQEGDSLWKIAEDNYSDPTRWQEIYELNKEVIGSNPDLIFPLTEIKMVKL